MQRSVISGEILMALENRLNPFPDESSLSKEDKQEIIRSATSIAGYPLWNVSLKTFIGGAIAFEMLLSNTIFAILFWKPRQRRMGIV